MTDQERKVMEMALEALDGLSEPYDVLKAQEALRQALAQDRGFDRTASHMAGEYVDTSWDTSDMAYRPNGMSVEQEPVAWWSTLFNVTYIPPENFNVWESNAYKAGQLQPLYTAPVSKPQDIAVGIDVTELGTQLVVRRGNEIIKSEFYHAPKCEWVSLTDEEFDNIYKRHDTYDSFARAIEAALKEKNT